MDGQRFRLFLESDLLERVQITEPFKFDGATFTVEQDKDRLGRDVTFGSEEVSLRFEKGFFEKADAPYTLPNGEVVDFRSMGLPFILDELSSRGFEMQMRLVISNNGVDFIVGLLDAVTGVTDERNYFECKVVQDTERMVISRQEETKVDVYSDKDINGNDITPLTSTPILIKPLPLFQTATWTSTGATASGFATDFPTGSIFGNISVGVNNSQQLQGNSTIENTLAYISSVFALTPAAGGLYAPSLGLNFTYLQARNELTNVKIDLTDIDATSTQHATDGVGNFVVTAEGISRLLILVGSNYADPRLIITVWEYTHAYPSLDPDSVTVPTSFPTVEIPLIKRGERVYIYFENHATAVFDNADGSGVTQYDVLMTQETMTVNISATSTAIASVVQAVRYTSLFEQNLLSINGMPLIAPRYQVGGEFYPRFAINGYGMRGFSDRPFYVTWKGLTSNLRETCSDYQVLPEGVFMGIYRDFYPDVEILSLSHQYELDDLPHRDLEIEPNARYTNKLLEWRNKNYEKEETAQNTLASIHTEAQLKFANSQVDGIVKIEVDIIVDPVKIEKLRKQAVTTDPLKASNDDDNIVVVDTIEIEDGTQLSFSANLLQRFNDSDQLQILNSANDGEDNDAGFQWDTLGISETDTITITDGENAGSWQVFSITPTVITLTPFFLGANFEGVDVLTFTYTITGVTLMNRTNEGFTSIIGLPEDFSNLNYSIKRNLLNYWGEYLATINTWHSNEDILNTYFKNLDAVNNVTTQKDDEEAITEFAPITFNQLPAPLLTTQTLRSRLVVKYEQALSMYEAYNTVHDNGTIGGYVTVFDAYNMPRKIYMTKSSYTWTSGVMDFEGEIKHDETFFRLLEDGSYRLLEDDFKRLIE